MLTDDDLEREFWSSAADGQLRLPRCPGCGKWWWYPIDTGPCCADRYEWHHAGNGGQVYTMTEVHKSFSPTADSSLPYSVGLIEVSAAPSVRLVATLPDRCRIGEAVSLSGVRALASGEKLLVFRR